MTRVYVMNVETLPDPAGHPEYLLGLPSDRKQKIRKLKHPQGRKQSLGAGLLLRYAQKPPVRSGGGALFWNLSHSGDVAVCAAGEMPAGCDVEQIRLAKLKIAERFFCKEENAYLRACKETERDREFTRLWTLKESYVKMTGEGLSLSFDRFEICFGERIQVRREGKIQSCCFREYAIPGYCLSVCAQDGAFAEEIEHVSWEKALQPGKLHRKGADVCCRRNLT